MTEVIIQIVGPENTIWKTSRDGSYHNLSSEVYRVGVWVERLLYWEEYIVRSTFMSTVRPPPPAGRRGNSWLYLTTRTGASSSWSPPPGLDLCWWGTVTGRSSGQTLSRRTPSWWWCPPASPTGCWRAPGRPRCSTPPHTRCRPSPLTQSTGPSWPGWRSVSPTSSRELFRTLASPPSCHLSVWTELRRVLPSRGEIWSALFYISGLVLSTKVSVWWRVGLLLDELPGAPHRLLSGDGG